MRLLVMVVVLALSGCRCAQQVQAVEPSRLALTPQRVSLGAVYVGQVVTGMVSAVNEGGAPAEADVLVGAPFTVEPDRLRLVRGEVAQVTVSFAALQPGRVSAVLLVGGLQVQVEAEALQVPQCVASTVCAEARFDLAGAQCVESTKTNGTACETRCVSGACNTGTCLGQLKGCDDANACTIDACDEVAGCSHSLRICPQPTAPCQVVRCDVTTGCGAEEAPDGTLCGPDDCLATQVDVCLSGACVKRVRPASGRCANRWVPNSIPARRNPGMAYDAARQRVVLFGGASDALDGNEESLSDTWEWDGTTWTRRTPASSPPGRTRTAMASDAVRQRVVLFGGSTGNGVLVSDTWEWDGTTWTHRTTAASPPDRAGHAMAYDAVRQRAVLFGGYNRTGTPRGDTWEWDGTTWTQRTPATAPSGRIGHALAYDAARRRVVLFGGQDRSSRSDTWEWDGITWTQRTPAASPPARSEHALVYDAVRRRVALYGGWDGNSSSFSDTWEWDGTSWIQRSPAPTPPARTSHALAYDAARQRVVLFGGSGNGSFSSDTWEWDGTTWTQRALASSPRASVGHAMTYDAARQRVVLFGGSRGPPGPGVPPSVSPAQPRKPFPAARRAPSTSSPFSALFF